MDDISGRSACEKGRRVARHCLTSKWLTCRADDLLAARVVYPPRLPRQLPAVRPPCPLSPASLAWKGQKGPVVSAALLEETAKGEQASGDAPRAEAAFAPENTSFSDDLEAFAPDYGLTRREAEVVPYIYKGRSAKVIASTLCVSESTVRTHIRRIYEKTEVHSKQELIDLIDRY